MRNKLGQFFNDYAIEAWIILVVAIIIGFVRVETLGQENSQRIDDIQQSRIYSCETTYRSFHVVFDPFLPPFKNRTDHEKKQIAKFNKILASKIKSCKNQVNPKK